MAKINWGQKLSSRKFWSLLIALIVAVLVMAKVSEESIKQVVAVIGAFSSIAIYILAEAYVDGKRVGQEVIIGNEDRKFIGFREENGE